jgi:hypothetical protein
MTCISICPDQSQLGQLAIPVVIALKSNSARLMMCPQFAADVNALPVLPLPAIRCVRCHRKVTPGIDNLDLCTAIVGIRWKSG